MKKCDVNLAYNHSIINIELEDSDFVQIANRMERDRPIIIISKGQRILINPKHILSVIEK